ncbi:phage protein NinX family protein [Sodalis endosymbiont of Spalangia cameroni]|uniref:phage protein NinX family protein n=1 Tax=Sodalis praecaptivus TaxID=1239307 RepID=UPI0031F74B6D
MKYDKMSDSEINRQVAILKNESSQRIKKGIIPNYCNSWCDAGPLIAEAGISITYDGVAWSAGSCMREVRYQDWKKYPESPLRLAMIVFLMIHESGELVHHDQQ